MTKIILLNKPFGMMTQFAAHPSRPTLANVIPIPGVYPAGRLDADSEGLLILTDNGALQARISHPRHKLEKTYWAQVEGNIDETAITHLQRGVQLNDGPTLPAKVRSIPGPELWPRDPPIRHRANIPTSWVELILREGRNRQVRRMTAAVGFPTLRLIRAAIGPWQLAGLMPGQYQSLTPDQIHTTLHQLSLGVR